MMPEEIGRLLLPEIAQRVAQNRQGISLRDFARALGEAFGGRFDAEECGVLVGEGLGFLQRAGMLVESPAQLGASFFRLSRAGQEAAARPNARVGAVSSQEARTLLHPDIARVALGDLERGEFDKAITAAFREVEIIVADRTNITKTGKHLFYDALSEKGALVPPTMNAAEVLSLRELFAGAYGFLRNPSTHRRVEDDAANAMRALFVASLLRYVLDDLN